MKKLNFRTNRKKKAGNLEKYNFLLFFERPKKDLSKRLFVSKSLVFQEAYLKRIRVFDDVFSLFCTSTRLKWFFGLKRVQVDWKQQQHFVCFHILDPRSKDACPSHSHPLLLNFVWCECVHELQDGNSRKVKWAQAPALH